MTRRKLTQDEIDLWYRVVDKTERLHPESAPASRPAPLPKPKPTKSPVRRIEPFHLGQNSSHPASRHDLQPELKQRITDAPMQMDRKAFQRMRRGKLTPEGRIDLHGRRLNSAHPALIRFILTSQASGKRLVLVITGKGKPGSDDGPIPTPRGVLKHQVPQWLALPPLAQAVLQVTPAHISHGGEGAYYVYLRRAR